MAWDRRAGGVFWVSSSDHPADAAYADKIGVNSRIAASQHVIRILNAPDLKRHLDLKIMLFSSLVSLVLVTRC